MHPARAGSVAAEAAAAVASAWAAILQSHPPCLMSMATNPMPPQPIFYKLAPEGLKNTHVPRRVPIPTCMHARTHRQAMPQLVRQVGAQDGDKNGGGTGKVL